MIYIRGEVIDNKVQLYIGDRLNRLNKIGYPAEIEEMKKKFGNQFETETTKKILTKRLKGKKLSIDEIYN
jgi:hypothetical protein